MKLCDVAFDVFMLVISVLAVLANLIAIPHNLMLLPHDSAYRAVLIALEIGLVLFISHSAITVWNVLQAKRIAAQPQKIWCEYCQCFHMDPRGPWIGGKDHE